MLGALLATGYAALFLLVIRRSPFFTSTGLKARTVGGLFLLKILAGTALWFVYTYLHTDRATADIYRYFDDGNIMFRAFGKAPLDYLSMLSGIGNDQPAFDNAYYKVMNNWYRQYESNMYNDAHTMIRFNAFVRLFSFGHYHVHTVFACFACTIGLVALYRAFVHRLPGHERMLMVAIFLLPSVLFWASGVIKEALLFMGLGLFVLSLTELQRTGFSWKYLALLPFCAVLLFFLKFYVLLSMMPALIAYLWCVGTHGRRALLKFALVFAVFAVLGVNSERIIPRFDILEVLWVKQRDFIGMATEVKAGSLVSVMPLEPTVKSFVSQVPHALYMTFLSPITTWRNGPLGLMSALENLVILIGLILAFRWKRSWGEVDRPLLYFCVGYCLLLALVIGWTTPVIGALVRYRAPLLPFLIIAALCVADPKRIPWPAWMNMKMIT
jgi:hypothetical protein